ncbi:MAG: phosphate regulon transcriptional regulatory protein PhoB [Oxalobacter sp.]|nr:MAG: phosphate regulon transcriptional regulatory protein PhoB [Oxalobacter sp.]
MASEKITILVVEDEPAIMELISFTMKAAGWNVKLVSDAAQAWEALKTKIPDMILLDWMLPDQSGLQLLTRLRGDFNFKTIPVIMLTAKGLEEDKVAGLERGADDYVTKPFSPKELTARINALLRRKKPEGAEDVLQMGSVILDPTSYTVTVDREKIDIGQAEFKLLRFLMANPERVFSRSQLLDKVWGTHAEIEERTVDVHVLRLRKALNDAETMLRTVRGVGYMFSER